MTTREEALDQIKSLMAEHHLTGSDISRLVSLPSHPAPESSNGMIQQILIYLGVAFVFMGICVYIGMIWDELNIPARIILTLGSGFVAFVLGLFSLNDPRFQRASTPLFLIAAGLQPLGLLVMMDAYLPHSGDPAKATSFAFLLMTVQNLIAYIALKRTPFAFFGLLFYFLLIGSTCLMLDLEGEKIPLMMGGSFLMIAWGLSRTSHRAIAPFYFFCASLVTAAASFDLLNKTSFDTVLIGVAAGLIYLSVVARSRAVLTVGGISLLGYLSYFTDEYFKDIVGWPIALIAMGFAMIGISIYAVKLGKKISMNSI